MMKFKRDKYKSSRGGYSRILEISCRKCGKQVLIYQKDGPGNLRRLYMDRIVSPEILANLQHRSLENIAKLKCGKCGEVLGSPYIYSKEKRKAYRLYVDTITKKIRKLNE